MQRAIVSFAEVLRLFKGPLLGCKGNCCWLKKVGYRYRRWMEDSRSKNEALSLLLVFLSFLFPLELPRTSRFFHGYVSVFVCALVYVHVCVMHGAAWTNDSQRVRCSAVQRPAKTFVGARTILFAARRKTDNNDSPQR